MTTYIPKWIVGLLCFITAAAISICWLLAAVCDPSWSFGTMTISTLGTSAVDSAKVLFNVGFCMLGGALMIVIGALYLFTKKSRLLHALYAILIIAGGIALIVVGCNPNDANYDVHIWAAWLSTMFIAVVYILATAETWLDRKYPAAAILTTGLLVTLLLTFASFEAAETSTVIFYLILLVYFGITWCTKKSEPVKSLYGSEVKI